jgi:hypothetical protein
VTKNGGVPVKATLTVLQPPAQISKVGDEKATDGNALHLTLEGLEKSRQESVKST